MPMYIINKEKTDGRYNEVHTTTCIKLPNPRNQEDLGWHADEIDAVTSAKKMGYLNADGCYHCCRKAHHG